MRNAGRVPLHPEAGVLPEQGSGSSGRSNVAIAEIDQKASELRKIKADQG